MGRTTGRGEFGVLPLATTASRCAVASASGLMKPAAARWPCRKMRCLTVRSCLDAWTATCICVEAIEEWAHFLSRGIYSVISMFDPQAVLIGGGISEQEKIYLLLDKYLQRFEEWEALRVPILPCELGNQAGRLGAVWLAKQKQARSA